MSTVDATLNYLGSMTERPVFCPGTPGKTNLVLQSQTVRITDARGLAEPPTLTREGFTLARQASAVRDFQNREQVESVYLDEVVQLVRAASGADLVLASPGAVARFVDRNNAARSAATAPAARFVHTDYTHRSAREHFLPQVMEPAEALRKFQRVVVYQTWRALSAPPQDVPLAVTDGRSAQPEDLITADTLLGDEYGQAQSFEYSMCRYNPAHRWFFYSNMQADEVLVFKGYDFDPAWRTRVPHSAFDDPTAPPGVAPRASIEARAFAFFRH
jgi:hypothetical protein